MRWGGGPKPHLGLLFEGCQEGECSRLPPLHNEVVEQAVQLQDQLLDGHVVAQLLLKFCRGVCLGRIIQHGLEAAPFLYISLYQAEVVSVVAVGHCNAAGQADEVLVL